MHKYRLLSKKGEGTFSEVLKAQSIKNGELLAIKCMKNRFQSIEQVNTLREIQALRRLSPHPNIINLYEVLYDQPSGRLALVFELMDCNLYEHIRSRRQYLPETKVKLWMYQLMKSVDHMHRNGIFHRDVKPENVLILRDEIVKLADFGSCRGIYSKQPYTDYISTRWYRAPECLLTDGYYGYKMDMWGVGCVMFEVLALYPLFNGENEMQQIKKIHDVLGTPTEDLLQKFKRYSSHVDLNFPAKKGTGIHKALSHVSPEGIDLIEKLLAYDPEERLSARQALRHPWLAELRAADKSRTLAQQQQMQGGSAGGTKASPHSQQGDDAVSTTGSAVPDSSGGWNSTTGHGGAGTSASNAGLPTLVNGKPKRSSHVPSASIPSIPPPSMPSSTTRLGPPQMPPSSHIPVVASAVPGFSDASLPPIMTSSGVLPSGGVTKTHGGSKKHHHTSKVAVPAAATSTFAVKVSPVAHSSNAGPTASSTSVMSSAVGGGGGSGAGGGGGGAGSGAGANGPKYLSPYSQKFIHKQQRHGDA